MTNQAKPTLATSHADLLTALEGALFVLDPNRDGAGHSKSNAIAQADAAIANARLVDASSPVSDDEIAITWHIDDVKEIRPDLTDEQCREVLQQADRRHDASVGINWDVLAIHADDLFPKESEAHKA
jgi:hypothetical protein